MCVSPVSQWNANCARLFADDHVEQVDSLCMATVTGKSVTFDAESNRQYLHRLNHPSTLGKAYPPVERKPVTDQDRPSEVNLRMSLIRAISCAQDLCKCVYGTLEVPKVKVTYKCDLSRSSDRASPVESNSSVSVGGGGSPPAALPASRLSSRASPLVVGTDCSGMEIPIMALRNLGVNYEHAFSSDNDKHAKNFILRNFVPKMYYDDVRTRTVNQLPNMDLYISGFPCQSFSVGGLQKGFNDKRGTVVYDIMNVIQTKQPKSLCWRM